MFSSVKGFIKSHESLKRFIKGRLAIRVFVEAVQIAGMCIEYFCNCLKYACKRLTGKYRNDNLLQYKNIHAGERCFVIATGPSLTLEDVNTLKAHNEYTFTVNSGVKILDKTDWRPTYYCICDPEGMPLLEAEYRKHKLNTVFYRASAALFWPSKIDGSVFIADNLVPLTIMDDAKLYAYNSQFASVYYERTKKIIPLFRYRQRISLDPSKGINEVTSVVFFAIQLALYMGFNKIYMLGADCDYALPVNCHSEIASFPPDDPRASEKGWYNFLISWYRDIKKFLDKHGGCNIYNATRGGKLDVLERVNFDDLFK